MGIKQLHKLLRKNVPQVYEEIHLSEYAFKKVAIDISLYLCKYKITHGQNWLSGFINLIACLRRNEIHCVFIYDNGYPPEKKEERKERQRQRNINIQKAQQLDIDIKEFNLTKVVSPLMEHIYNKKILLITQKRLLPSSQKPQFEIKVCEDALEKMKSYVLNIKPEDYEHTKELFNILDVPYYTAPLEAETMCISIESYISLNCGISIQMKLLQTTNSFPLLSYKNNTVCHSKMVCYKYNGIKKVIKIILEDGSQLILTPEHQILKNTIWTCASDMLHKKVKVGPSYPKIDIIKEIKINKFWVLQTTNYKYNCNNIHEYYKSMAFSRILGLFLSTNWGELNFNCSTFHQNDFNSLACDIQLLSDTFTKSIQTKISIPSKLLNSILNLDGVTLKNNTSFFNFSIPKFILDIKCPIGIVREFLGGIFGGDGIAPMLSPLNIFTYIKFSQKTSCTHLDDTMSNMKQMLTLLKRFNINNTFINHHKIKNGLIVNLYISQIDLIKFTDTIGFRYCINKTIRISIVSSYIKIINNNNNKYLHQLNFLKNTNTFDLFKNNRTNITTYDMDVISIENYNETEVCDIQVDITPNFIVEGIITHNCSDLCINNQVEAVLSEDTDVLAYGAPNFLTKINTSNDTCIRINYNNVLKHMKLNTDQFLDLCIMCGCDYNKNIYMVGPEKAYKYIQKYISIENLSLNTQHDIIVLNHIKTRELFRQYKKHNDVKVTYCGNPDFEKLSYFIKKHNITHNINSLTKSFTHNIIVFNDKNTISFDNKK